MRRKLHLLLTSIIVTIIGFANFPIPLEAGDHLELKEEYGILIFHQQWPANSLTFKWKLHNAEVDADQPNPVDVNAQKVELMNAFKEWVDVPISNIQLEFDGLTNFGTASCNFESIVTWSDPLVTEPGSGVIAKVITTCFVGEDRYITSWDPMSRVIPVFDGTNYDEIELPVDLYPDGSILPRGAILDADMVFNDADFVYITTPDNNLHNIDIRSTATHEVGHMLGISHNSLAFMNHEPTTMRTGLSYDDYKDPIAMGNRWTLAPDDKTQSGRGYPGKGFYPDGSEPWSTGEITGRVTQPGGVPAEGVRVWAYLVSDTSQPMYETFTVTQNDWELEAGKYVLDGLRPGDYYVCIVAWGTGIPTELADDIEKYNCTTEEGIGHKDFSTEFYDDAASATTSPDLTSTQFYRKVEVAAGKETKNIDFVTGTQTTDFVLVMDRSGSMQLMSGTKTKLKALQDAAKLFIGYLDLFADPKHRLGLVQFEETPIPLTPVFDLQALTSSTVNNAKAAINTMDADGMTNIIAGVEAGIDQLTNIANPHERQIMLLFTDGKHNRPVGSNLDVIHDKIEDNDITLYSVGFGDDISDDVLNLTAVDSGGLHVNEPELDELALANHFLTIAASAVGEEVFVDPRYSLNAGEKVEEKVEVTPDDQSLTFVVHWARSDLDGYDVTITAPDDCPLTVGQSPVTGFDFRLGDTYRIVRIPLPLSCQGSNKHAGTWTIKVKRDSNATAKDEMEILVFGDSRTGLFAGSSMSRYGPVVTARLVRNGRLLRGATISGEVYLPVPATGLSEEQDKLGADFPQASLPSRPSRKPLPIRLHDDGLHSDSKGEDGIFAVPVPVEEEGMYRVRLIAKYKGRQQIVTREIWTSFYFDGRRIIGSE